MKHLLLILIVLFVILCSGCAEYLHAPDEIHLGMNVSQTNLGNSPFIQGKPVTTGMYVGGVWYRTKFDKGRE